MSEITSKLAEIRERHEAVTGHFADEKGAAAHWDRDTLLRMAELLIGAQQYSDEARAALEAELEAAENRVCPGGENHANPGRWGYDYCPNCGGKVEVSDG